MKVWVMKHACRLSIYSRTFFFAPYICMFLRVPETPTRLPCFEYPLPQIVPPIRFFFIWRGLYSTRQLQIIPNPKYFVTIFPRSPRRRLPPRGGCSARGPDPFHILNFGKSGPFHRLNFKNWHLFHILFPKKVPSSHTCSLKKDPFPIPGAPKVIPFGRSIPV